MEPADKLLRRVFIPIERNGVFRTHDGEQYRRIPNAHITLKGERVPFGGTITRVVPKVRGKAARRADRRARRAARTAA